MNQNQQTITQALSLRQPQKDSLEILTKVVEVLSLQKDVDLNEALAAIQEIAPKLKDFERSFPSICFSIATGVGKTRLMGAFIAYLYLEEGIRNFFVLAPNLTIYNKLIKDFTPNTPKYVLPGIPDFAINAPIIITGETYHQIGGLFDKANEDRVKINIFNISKINSDKDSRGTPRIRSFAEYLGQSYFDYLSGLKDLVIIMDEAHRYRASAGMAAINELNPVLGLELTATAKSTGASGSRFKNIVYDYPLAQAIHDGFVKKPAIVGRSDFDKDKYPEDRLEELKIKDGLKIHESIRAELEVYADNKNVRKVKPFVLIIAKNIEHAEELNNMIESDDFENGEYKGKSIVVHSKKSGEEKDEVIERLLAVEDANEPTEIVIHVDMLKEGWDVNNLYTIIPLKTADSKILVEQSIGRGLRLPFGQITGEDTIDRLHIIAHDKFNEIIKAAAEERFEFQKIEIDKDEDITGKIAKENISTLETRLFGGVETPASVKSITEQKELPIFNNNKDKEVAKETLEAIEDLGKVLSSSKELLDPENQKRLVEEVKSKIEAGTSQKELLFGSDSVPNYDAIVKKVTEKFVDFNLDIPMIKIRHKIKGDIGFTYKHFDLDLTPFNDLRPVPQAVIVKELVSGVKENKGEAEFQDIYDNVEEYLLVPLIEHTEINYSTESELLYHLIGQVLAHIRTYSKEEIELRKILFFHAQRISNSIFEQMMAHIQLAETEIIIKVDSSYVPFRTYKVLEDEKNPPISFRNSVRDKMNIRNMIFDGFKKCLFSKQKFDSDTERQLANVLEDEKSVIKWFKINDDKAKEVFDLKYMDPKNLKSYYYCPDFIVETENTKYIIETKAATQINDETVQAKKKVAHDWCKNATDFETVHGGKPWTYVLVPHNTLVGDRSFSKIVEDFRVKE